MHVDPEGKSMRRRRQTDGGGNDAAAAPDAQRRPGSHDPEGNRRAVLDAARRLFGAHGYKGVGVRAIAAEAGVTPGLVMAYFGTKDGLFRAAVGSGAGVTADVLAATGGAAGGAGGARDLPGVLARAYLDRWDRLPADDPWPALIRSAASHPPSAELLRTILDTQVGEPLAQVLGTTAEADVRATVIRSVLFGVVMERYVFAHEPAASVSTAELAPLLTDVLATAFGGGPAADPHVPGPEVADAGAPAQEHTGGGTAALFALLDDCAAHHRLVVGRTARAHGISPPAHDVLAVLREAGAPYRLTMGEVAAAGRVRAGGLTQQADRLTEAGLIRRERDTEDRRIVRLCLTPEGLELTDRVSAARSTRERELLTGLGHSERRRLTDLLETLSHTLGAGDPEQ